MLGRKLQHQAGLDDHTPVTLSDIDMIEAALGGKIIVFLQNIIPNNSLVHFDLLTVQNRVFIATAGTLL